ncbi:ferric iron ABC transporter permease [Gluconacetobacter johannae DSM 13595]|uniref:Iron ABC transporter permease n=1 Tax=Gluconacetobacter johannae TaxID=112140 RepID=A0A7W4J9V1_9PROT|nr:iron ABC transporter permease [Gluconacetobacter johannae]MBB2177233.1 iron ABC transporter permease [Gluconacetobacter johannae]GBQ81867.1 ferric iron ABC transporter permease [Gluconacetobacter johannae DSM 13595]
MNRAPHPAGATRISMVGVSMGAIVIVLVLCFVYPLVRFLLLPLVPGWAPLTALGASQPAPGVSWQAVWNTVRLSAEAGLLVVPPGLAAGFLLERRRWAGNRLLGLTLWVVFLMPSYLLTMGWQILMAAPILRAGIADRLFYGEAGIVFLLTVKGLAFSAMTARAGWSTLGADMDAAFHVHVPSAARRLWLTLRLLMPVAGTIFMVQLVAASQDFGIAATLGAQAHMPLVIYAIYQDLSTVPVDFTHAAALSWDLVLLAVSALGVQAVLGRRSVATVSGRQRRYAPRPCGWGMRAMAWLLTGGIMLAGFAVPALALLAQGMTGEGAGHAVPAMDAEDWRSIGLSLRYAFVASVLAVLLAAVVLGGRLRPDGSGRLMSRLLVWLTVGNMAVPGVILGAAYVIGFNGAVLPLYGTATLLIMAYAASHLPIAIRFLDTPFARLHRSLGEAARVHGMSPLGRVEGIYAPLLLRALVWAWGMVFVTLFFELPLSQILYPAGAAPLGVRLLSLDDSLHYGAEARLALVAMAACLAVVGTATVLVPRLLVPRFLDPDGACEHPIARTAER